MIAWSFEHISHPQFEEASQRIQEDAQRRKHYLQEAFSSIILDLTEEINELQDKLMKGDQRVQDKIEKKQKRIEDLKQKRKSRLEKLDLMQQLNRKLPEVMGCAYVVPLNQLEYKSHFGMSRDDEVEHIAMQFVMEYEIALGWNPEDVSADNMGYDIRSVNADELKRYIEVKGRAAVGDIMLSENEMNRLSQLGEQAWLYIVVNCKSSPQLYKVQNPANTLKFELKSKGIQYFLAQEEWKAKAFVEN